jgi:UPF0755 protein
MFKTIWSWIVIAIIGVLIWSGWAGYASLFRANSKSPQGEYSFVIEQGDSFESIEKKLAKDNVSQPTFLSVSKLYRRDALYPGAYKLQLPATTEEIIDQINSQSRVKAKEAEKNQRESKSVTIKEGGDIRVIADILVKEKIIEDKDDFLNKAKNPGLYNYEFLPEPLDCSYGDRLTCVEFYLEGYLYPDTYEFFYPSTPDEVIKKMLENFQTKVWSKTKNELTKAEFDKAMIMASVLERETGRSNVVPGESKDVLANERKQVASVFYNRLDQGINWSSDPTVNYGLPNLVCQQTVVLKDCVYLDDPRVQTKYNTYLNKGYPIGPISNPQLANIQSAINPADTDYVYFVADLNGVTLFGETDTDHSRNMEEVTKINQEIEKIT